jgi:hypothetical protein
MPEVTPTSYLALFVDALVQQLADCAAFRTLVGAADATAAKAFIIKDAGGDPASTAKAVDGSALDCSTSSFAVVRRGDAQRTSLDANLSWYWEIPFELDLIMRPTSGDSEPSAFTRAENTAGTIGEEFEALFSASASRIAYGELQPAAIVRADSIKALRGAFVARLAGTTRSIR